MGNFSRIVDRLEIWYRGKYIQPPENDPDSPIIIVSAGWYEQPLLAKILGAVWSFYCTHWQWLWSTIIAVISLYFAVLSLK